MTRAEPNAGFVPRPSFVDVVPYVSNSAPAALHLADNTNVFGAPPTALATIHAATAEQVLHYPPSSGPALLEAIASYHGVRPNEVVLACGGDGVIDCAFRALCEPGNAVVFPVPTFMMCRYFALTNGLTPIPVAMSADGSIDVEGVLRARASLIYVCAPNNPTGGQPRSTDLRALLERANGIVVLDEAYSEFAGETLVGEVVQQDRAIVVRTFSKAFGLAGLRVGYAIGAPPLMREIEKARGPFAVSSVSLRAATAAITSDLPWVQARVKDAIASRIELVRLLTERGLTPLPSAANFVLVPVADARRVAERLATRGIAVRAFEQLPGIGDALRIAVAPLDAMRRVADALSELAP
ncbi:MAG TPA: histidinol-phosphate transaminase [Gemmatimonadaceae bacterium]